MPVAWLCGNSPNLTRGLLRPATNAFGNHLETQSGQTVVSPVSSFDLENQLDADFSWFSLFFFSFQSDVWRVPQIDCLCGLVVRVLGYRSGGPGSIPGTTKKKSSGSGTGSTQPREYN
jgi:hypothetical protein